MKIGNELKCPACSLVLGAHGFNQLERCKLVIDIILADKEREVKVPLNDKTEEK